MTCIPPPLPPDRRHFVSSACIPPPVHRLGTPPIGGNLNALFTRCARNLWCGSGS
ncbi:hypothetical protein BDZ94DRAFT_1278488 [Collybia nuda]|uniref:Uncharacterized protein n=1 Tax=Collybia nuda TaxID=64659 RepID=A0A9P6CBN0_9AGAR|nr:hypothetical protein BDZ94DRAFT_1278488 [Collybia nuda]